MTYSEALTQAFDVIRRTIVYVLGVVVALGIVAVVAHLLLPGG